MADNENPENVKPAPEQADVKEAAPAPKKAAAKPSGKLAVVLIRNTTRASNAIIDTLTMLRLKKKFTCNIVDDTPSTRGMINKVKDFVTYGEVDTETIKLLDEKRPNKDKEGKPLGWYALHPPIGGFERKGIKRSFSQGGVLGYRGAKMTDLIKKMA